MASMFVPPNPPYEQAHQSLQQCPECGQEMWASLDGKVNACWPCVQARNDEDESNMVEEAVFSDIEEV